jgi:hypothetical protein
MHASGRRGAALSRRVALALAILAAAATPSAFAGASPQRDCDGSWQAVTVPTGKLGDAALRAVAADAADDAWVVGDTSSGRPFTAHWDGSAWAPVPVHGVTGHATLQSVAVVAPNDVWAVGSRQAHNGQILTLVVHWDGTSWTQVPSPSPSRRANQLYDVAAIDGNAWAVGTTTQNQIPFLTRTFVLRWDGSTWTVLRTPNPDRRTGENALASVSGGGPTNSWAVGLTGDPTDRGLVLHWTGSDWIVDRSLPTLGDRSSFTAIDVPVPRRILAVGSLSDATGQHMFALRRITGGWELTEPPDPPGLAGTLEGAAWDGKTTAWAVGEADAVSGGAAPATLTEQWDGTAWSVVASPDPETGANVLTGVASAGGISFASGYGRTGARHAPFVLTYC